MLLPVWWTANFDSSHKHDLWMDVMWISSSLISQRTRMWRSILGQEQKPYCKGYLAFFYAVRDSKYMLIFWSSMLFYWENLAGIFLDFLSWKYTHTNWLVCNQIISFVLIYLMNEKSPIFFLKYIFFSETAWY